MKISEYLHYAPAPIITNYNQLGIKNLFLWQVECLASLKSPGNLLFSAPSSAGKTLLCELLALKTVFEYKKKVIFVVPYKIIVRSKIAYFERIVEKKCNIGSYKSHYSLPYNYDIMVVTLENADRLIMQLLISGELSAISMLIIDGLHLLDDRGRGYTLEMFITKVMYFLKKDPHLNIALVASSVVEFANFSELATWLKAAKYSTDVRTISVAELVQNRNKIYNNKGVVKYLPDSLEIGEDNQHIVQLCLESLAYSGTVLIFATARDKCESLAKRIATCFSKILGTESEWSKMLNSQLNRELIDNMSLQLKTGSTPSKIALREVVPFGIAFHHAGLTTKMQAIIEESFQKGGLKILVSTTTLIYGHDLPISRVIISTAHFYRGHLMSPLTYCQMVGRAGRLKSKLNCGESIIICRQKVANALMSAKMPKRDSWLHNVNKFSLCVLNLISSGIAVTFADLVSFVECTLWVIQPSQAETAIKDYVHSLRTNSYIHVEREINGKEKYQATSLGYAFLSQHGVCIQAEVIERGLNCNTCNNN